MRSLTALIGCALLAFGGQAAAACSEGGGWSRVTNLAGGGGALVGKTVCGTAVSGSDKWQEYHSGSSGQPNNLIEWAKGSDPVDPTHPVGSWSVLDDGSTSAQARYDYGTGGTYTFQVYQNGGSYSFCDGSTEVATATTASGQVSCGF